MSVGRKIAGSILTWPVGRVQLAMPLSAFTRPRRFQSSPGPWAECNVYLCASLRAVGWVSILTRPVGRVQRSGVSVPVPTLMLFQSSPGPWAECNLSSVLASFNDPRSFNPHPARGPSATLDPMDCTMLACFCFNPHPARGPSATPTSFRVSSISPLFQSSPGPWAECNGTTPYPATCCPPFQSSPGPWAECNAGITQAP